VAGSASVANQLLLAWRKGIAKGSLATFADFVPAMIVAEQPEKGSDLAVVESRL
jgi:hypothetical protein